MYKYYFRDNGITTQISIHQLLTETASYFIFMIFSVELWLLKDDEARSINSIRTSEIINAFVMFVIQPLFFFNGDANFRIRVMNQGLLKAFKHELFSAQQDNRLH